MAPYNLRLIPQGLDCTVVIELTQTIVGYLDVSLSASPSGSFSGHVRLANQHPRVVVRFSAKSAGLHNISASSQLGDVGPYEFRAKGKHNALPAPQSANNVPVLGVPFNVPVPQTDQGQGSVLSISLGGTGSNTAEGALQNLGGAPLQLIAQLSARIDQLDTCGYFNSDCITEGTVHIFWSQSRFDSALAGSATILEIDSRLDALEGGSSSVLEGRVGDLETLTSFISGDYVSKTGSYSDPTWLTSLDAGKVTGSFVDLDLLGVPTAPTAAPGTNTDQIATTAFVLEQGFISGNQNISISGDVSGSGSTAITLTLANVVSPGTATKLTYNAKGLVTGGASLASGDIPNLDTAKITTGIFGVARGGTGADLSATGGVGQVLKQSAAGGAISVAILSATDIPNLDTAKITTGLLSLARGGTEADLSATGGAGQFLKQSSAGGAVTVGLISASDVPNLDASKITTGALSVARGGTGTDLSSTGGTGQILKQSTTGGVVTVGTLLASEVPALDASKITSGTIGTARLGSGTASSSTYLRGDGTWATISSGSSSLSALTDVNLTSTSNNDVLIYNSSSSKWVNNNGSSLANLNASNLSSGTVPTARLGSGTANNTTYLRGDGTWATVATGGGTPGGSNGQLQYNNAGVFGGLAGSTVYASDGAINLVQQTASQPCLKINGPIYSSATDLLRVEADGGTVAHFLVAGTGQVSVEGTTRTPHAMVINSNVSGQNGLSITSLQLGSKCLNLVNSNGLNGIGMTVSTSGSLVGYPSIYAESNGAGEVLILNSKGTGTTLTCQNNGTTVATISQTGVITGIGSGLTALNASNLSSGTVPTARLGSGTADNTTYLRGDGTWAVVSGGGSSTLSGLSDVAITSPAANHVLIYNSGTSKWVNNNGSSLANLNASNLASGTVPTARLGSGVASSAYFLRGDGIWSNAVDVSWAVSGGDGTSREMRLQTSGSNRWVIRADNTGEVGTNIGSDFGIQGCSDIGFSLGTYFSINRASGLVSIGTANISQAGVFTGSGSGLTSLNASNLSSGTVPTARLGSGTADSTTFLRGDGAWATVSGSGGSSTLSGLTDVTITSPAANHVLIYNSGTSKWVNNNGSSLANLSASNLASGTVPDARLSSNVPLLSSSNLLISPSGSSTSSPRAIGVADLSSGQAMRVHLGGAGDSIGSAYGFRTVLQGYWGIEVHGNRQTTTPRGYNSAGSSEASLMVFSDNDVITLSVNASASQTQNLTQWRGTSGAVVASVTVAGVFGGNGSGLTNLNADNITSGYVPLSRLGTGIPNSGCFLRGDGIWSNTINNNSFIINGNSGTYRDLALQTGFVNRWLIRASNDSESGGNAGTNLQIQAFGDANSNLGVYLSILRSSGLITMGSTTISQSGTISSVRGQFTAAADADVPFYSKAASPTQSGDLFQCRNNSDVVLSRFDSGGLGFVEKATFLLAMDGTDLVAGSNLTNIGVIVSNVGKILKWKAKATANPVGGGFSFSIMKNGSSIFASPIVIAANTTTVQAGSTFNTTALAEGDELTINASSVGTGVKYVNITLYYIVKNN